MYVLAVYNLLAGFDGICSQIKGEQMGKDSQIRYNIGYTVLWTDPDPTACIESRLMYMYYLDTWDWFMLRVMQNGKDFG